MAKKTAVKSRVGSFRGKTTANAEKRKRGSGFGYLRIPNGVSVFVAEADEKYLFDFLPYEVKDKNHPDRDTKLELAVPGSYWYKRPFEVHKNVGPKNEAVICPRSFGKTCPICDYRDSLKKEGADEAEIKACNTSRRNLYVVIPRGVKKVEEKPHLFDFSDYLFQEKFEEQLADDDRWGDFPHPTEGCSVRIRFAEGSFGGNKYPEPTRFDFEERDTPIDDSVLDDVPCLDECFDVLSYEELKANFFAVPTEDEDDDEEEEKPRKKKEAEKPASRRKPEPEPEEEEEEEEDEPEEEEEEELELSDEIEACKTVGELMTIAHNNKEFKKHLKTFATIKKASQLKAEMLAIIAPEEEEEEEEEEEPAPKKKPAAGGKNSCPNGYKFGKDTDEYDECDNCPVWKACYKKQQEG